LRRRSCRDCPSRPRTTIRRACLPAMAGLIVLADPIVALLFQWREVDAVLAARTADALRLYAAGLVSFAWLRVSAQGFYAVQDTRTPVIVATGAVLLNIALSMALVGPLGYRGLAIANTIAFSLNAMVLLGLVSRRHGRVFTNALIATLARMLFAALMLAGASLGAYVFVQQLDIGPTLLERLVTVGMPVALGGTLYFAVCVALEIAEAQSVLRRVVRR